MTDFKQDKEWIEGRHDISDYDREIIEKECKNCGEEIKEGEGYVGADGIFCSEKCFDKYITNKEK